MVRHVAEFIQDYGGVAQGTQGVMDALTDASLAQPVGEGHRTLGRVAWHVVQTIPEMLGKTGLSPEGPATASAIADAYRAASRSVLAQVAAQWTDETLEVEDELYGSKWRRGSTLGALLHHEIHHRGQIRNGRGQALLSPFRGWTGGEDGPRHVADLGFAILRRAPWLEECAVTDPRGRSAEGREKELGKQAVGSLRLLLFVPLAILLAVLLWRWSPGGPTRPSEGTPRETSADARSAPPPVRLRGLPAPPPVEPVDAAMPPPDDTAPKSSTVEGQVRDAVTSEGVPYARVVVGWHTWDAKTGRQGRRTFGVDADRDGYFRLDLGEVLRERLDIFESAGRGRRVFRWHLEGQEDDRVISAEPGRVTRVVLWTRKTFRLQGRVVDAAGLPLEWVQIDSAIPVQVLGRTSRVRRGAFTAADGTFDVGPFDEDPHAGLDDAQREHLAGLTLVTLVLDGYAPQRFDPREIPGPQRERMRITLTRGLTLAGVLVDDRGRPLPDVAVAAEYGNATDFRRGTRTDAEGRWRLEQLAPGPMSLRARAFAQDAKYEQTMTLKADDLELRLVAESIRLSFVPVTVPALGLQLVDVDDEIREVYGLGKDVRVLIFHPGEDPEALGIGRLEKGYGLWMVGDEGVESVQEALEKLIAQAEGSPGSPGVRVVYTFWNEDMVGTNTQYVRITPENLEALKATLENLER